MLRATAASVLVANLGIGVCAQAPTPSDSGTSSPADPIVASVRRSYDVRQSDVDAWRLRHAPAQFARLRQDTYESNRQAVDALIGEYLLAEEAAAHGLLAEELVQRQLDQTPTPRIREDDVREIYERSRSTMGTMTFSQAESAIRSYLEESQRNEARQAFIETLVANAAPDVVIHLQPPRYDVPVSGNEESLGADSARLTVVEYSDFQCPFCKRAAPDLRKLVGSFPGTVRLVWHHFPLPGHPEARGAAEAAACAGEQNAFWEYHDQLFANQDSLEPLDLHRYGEDVGLDMSQFEACMESHRYESTVTEDMAGGHQLGISATPAVFINGRLILGAVGYDVYKRVIDEELTAARARGSGKP